MPDVVIAGYGPAGAAAALAAHDAGRSVLVVEAAARGGGNARYSGGFLFDVPDDAATDHLEALCFGRTGRQVLTTYAAGLRDLDGWLRSLGGTTAPFDLPPTRLRALLTYLPRNPNRPRLPSWAVFDEAARRAGPLKACSVRRTTMSGAPTTLPRSSGAGS